MLRQSLPKSAERFRTEVKAVKDAALVVVARAWATIGNDFDAGWETVGPTVSQTVRAAQVEVAGLADGYVPAVLAETGQRVREPEYAVAARQWAGTAGSGYPVEQVAYGAVIRTKTAVAGGASIQQALRSGGLQLVNSLGTVIADTERSAVAVRSHSMRVSGYVRMLTPPSCGRCVVLAGEHYTSRQAFLRHPGCDCVHIPAAESIATDLAVNAQEYLDSLDDKGLARVLGSKANAQAWQDGADFNQLVNAYRRKGAVQSAQQFDRRIKYTTEGTTRRGLARSRMDAAGVTGPRLMPETIYQIAPNRDAAVQMLRDYGWVV